MGDRLAAEEAAAARDGREVRPVRLVFRKLASDDQRRFNLPQADEVAAVFVGDDGEPPGNVDFTVYPREGGLTRLAYIR